MVEALELTDQMRLAVESAGLTMMAVGLWWIWPPMALIVVGALLLVASVYGRIRK